MAGCWPTSRPGLVKAIVTVEPMGPAFAHTRESSALAWELTAAPISYDPPRDSPAEVRVASPSTLRISDLAELPVAVVSGEERGFCVQFGLDDLRLAT